MKPESSLELVVARFHEDLAWTNNIPKNVRLTIYDKSDLPLPQSIPLPNIGREAHTYLHHLVTRYDTLAEITIFCQGKPFDHCHDFHKQLRNLAEESDPLPDFRWLGFLIDADDPRGRRLFVHWSKNLEKRELAMDEFYPALFWKPAPEELIFYAGAQFAVTATTIRRHSIQFYQKALALGATFPDAAHCFERIWDRVFGVCGVDPELLVNGLPLHLKPIRRLRSNPKEVCPNDKPCR